MEMNDEILELIKQRMEKGRKQYGHGLLDRKSTRLNSSHT